MQLKTFRGSDMSDVLTDVRQSLGDEAMILDTRHDDGPDGRGVEVTATTSETVEDVYRRFGGDDEPARRAGGGSGPRVLALVGPTGAGKTLTAAKLALHPDVFGPGRASLLSLDTYRPAGFEPLSVYAEVAGLPLEVVYHPDEAGDALRRLSTSEVVVVDTPGRSPRAPGADDEWQEILEELRPDEVHLVLPAHLRRDLAREIAADFEDFGVTHLLLSKLDEVPDDDVAASLAMELDLPGRWLTTGQEVPGDLEACGPRILGSLGLATGERASAGRAR